MVTTFYSPLTDCAENPDPRVREESTVASTREEHDKVGKKTTASPGKSQKRKLDENIERKQGEPSLSKNAKKRKTNRKKQFINKNQANNNKTNEEKRIANGKGN